MPHHQPGSPVGTWRRGAGIASILGLVLATGCGGGEAPDSTTDTATTVNSCDPGETRHREDAGLVLETTLVPTVLAVSWERDEDDPALLRWRWEGGEGGLDSAAAVGTQVPVLGVPTDTALEIWLQGPDPDNPWCSEPVTATTGGSPPELPTLALTHTEAAASTGFTLLSVTTDEGSHVVALDAQGNVVWVVWAEFVPTRTGFLRDGSGVFSVQEGSVRVLEWSGELRYELRIPDAHTDALELPDGRFAMLAKKIQSFELSDGPADLLGDVVGIIDTEGDYEIVASSFDWVEPSPTANYRTADHDPDTEVLDWSHVNAISYRESTGGLLLSAGNLQAIAEIDADTGDLRWLLTGGTTMVADFETWSGTFDEQATDLVDAPHSAYELGGEVVVFNRRTTDGTGKPSTVDGLVIDPEARTFERAWSYQDPEGLSVYYMGEARPIADDLLQVIWSTAAQVDQVTTDGQSVWQLKTELGAIMGFGDHTGTLGLPR